MTEATDEQPRYIRETLEFENELAALLYGEGESTLHALEQELGIQARARGNRVRLKGESTRVNCARKVLEELYAMLQKEGGGESVDAARVRAAVQAVAQKPGLELRELYADVLGAAATGGRRIKAKNLAQRCYVELIAQQDLVFSIGPAGTGKTYLAMAMACAALNRRQVTRLVLTRPAVEAGERLGFLPGSMAEKVNPYLRPLYDALHDMMNFEKAQRLMERGVIEVAPLAFMRGRTLNGSFVILDEAQNTTPEQMKMFLTRLGYDSKAVVTGDVTQIDLPSQQGSGLVDALKVLRRTKGIGVMRFDESDVVRHPLVQAIVRAYDRRERRDKHRETPEQKPAQTRTPKGEQQ